MTTTTLRGPSSPRTTNTGASAPTTETNTTAATTATTGTQATDNVGDIKDGFSTGGTQAPAPTRNGGLPDTVFNSPNATVTHGTDPGDFYCEHMFYITQQEANRPGSSVKTNSHGEKLVGFLHIPRDSQTYGTDAPYSQEERHKGTREVVGSAIRGYYSDAAAQDKSGPIKIQLNGYDTFMDVKNNPTGDFVSNRENIDAAMKKAFGNDLLSPQGEPYTNRSLKKDPSSQTYQYLVRDPETRKVRSVLIHTQKFAVADETINGKKGQSVQSAMDHFKPHAVLSMGVASGQYLAEFHADDGGMKMGQGRDRTHDGSVSPTQSMPDNYSLARAIHRGSQPPVQTIPVSSLLATGIRRG